MRVLQTSDWHLGQIFYGQSRTEEHVIVLKQIIEICKVQKVDVLLICGDVFDTYNPSAESEETWFWFLKEIHVAAPMLEVFVISGNHDSAQRLRAPGPVLQELRVNIFTETQFLPAGTLDTSRHIVLREFAHLDQNTPTQKLAICLVPFVRPSEYPAWLSTQEGASLHDFLKLIYEDLVSEASKNNCPILVTGHLFASGASLSENSERKIQRGNLEAFSLSDCTLMPCHFAMGHLHKSQLVNSKNGSACYSGSLFPLSFTESSYVHGVTLLEWIGNELLPTLTKIPIVRPRPILRLGHMEMQAEALIAELEQLPDKQKNEFTLPAFAEVRLDITPGKVQEKRDQISKILEKKGIELLQFHIKSQSFLSDDSMTDVGAIQPKGDNLDKAHISNLDPLWVFRQTFLEQWQKHPTLELEKMFLDLLGEAQHTEGTKVST